MLTPITQFNANAGQTRELIAVARAIDSQTTAAISVGDIYRASLVLAVSAFDHYIHEKALVEMLEIADGSRSGTDSFARFRVSMGSLGSAFNDPPSKWLEQEIRTAHSMLTFQRAEAVADAVRLFHSVPIWPAVADILEMDTKQVKSTLDLIVDRRNKIAHEADCEPTGLGVKWPIWPELVTESIDFLENVVKAVELIV